MMTTKTKDDFDPYRILRLAADATAEQIKAAFRRESKVHHPDAGGDATAFAKVLLAYRVLSEPERRAVFDETGVVEEDRPNNDQANAIAIIDSLMAMIVSAYLKKLDPMNDPRKIDVVVALTSMVEDQFQKQTAELAKSEKHLAFLLDFERRFQTDDITTPIERLVRRQIAEVEKSVLTMKEHQRARELALAILSTYKFKSDCDPG